MKTFLWATASLVLLALTNWVNTHIYLTMVWGYAMTTNVLFVATVLLMFYASFLLLRDLVKCIT